MSETNKNATEELFDITISDKAKFESNVDTKYIRLNSIGEMINQVFAVFTDYRGCTLSPVMIGQRPSIDVNLYFEPGTTAPEGITNAFESIVDATATSGKPSVVDSIRRRENLSKNKKFKITDDGISGLDKFIDKTRLRKNDSWAKMYVSERVEPSMYGATKKIITEVKHISVLAVIKEIYGDKDEVGSKLWYEITPLRQLTPVVTSSNPDWLVQITSLNEGNLKEFGKDLGLVLNLGQVGGVNMIARRS